MSGGEGPLWPVYLVLDVGPGAEEKRAVVDGALRRLVEVVQDEPAAFARLRVALLTFDEEAKVHLGLSDLSRLSDVPQVVVAKSGRVWRRVFRRLAEQIRTDRRTAPMDRPVVLFVADGPPDDPPEWPAVFDALLTRGRPRRRPGRVRCGAGPAHEGVWPGPGRDGRRRRDEDPDHPLDVIADAVLALREPPRRAAERTWTGNVTPTRSVTRAGAAARSGRCPDPAEWGRSDTILDGMVIADGSGRPAVELRAASVRGLSHRFYGKVRQDQYTLPRLRTAAHLVVAVSDGVSGGSQSHTAAKLVCI